MIESNVIYGLSIRSNIWAKVLLQRTIFLAKQPYFLVDFLSHGKFLLATH